MKTFIFAMYLTVGTFTLLAVVLFHGATGRVVVAGLLYFFTLFLVGKWSEDPPEPLRQSWRHYESRHFR